MAKHVVLTEDLVSDITKRCKPGQSVNAWLREWLGLPAAKFGRPRGENYISPTEFRSEWFQVAELEVGQHIIYPWLTLENGHMDEDANRRINPGVMRMAKRAKIKVQTDTPRGALGLRVTRIA